MSYKSLIMFILIGMFLHLPAAGPAVAETVTSPDGVSIHYLAAGSGTPALVFVHCWSGDASYWAAQVEHFSPTHRVICVDLAGHGGSGLEREDWTMAAFGADVQAVVEKEGLDDVVLIGHSMGGAVIAEAALLMPQRVRGLVGVDNFQKVSIGITDEQIAGVIAFFRNDFAGNVKVWTKQLFPEGADSVFAADIIADMASAPPEVGLGSMENLLHWYNERPATVLPALPAPLLCINSDINPTDVAGLKALRPDYSLRLMPGRSHFLAQEDPATFNRLLEECLVDFSKRKQ